MVNTKLLSERIDYLVSAKYPAATADLEIALYKHTGDGLLTSADVDIVENIINIFHLTNKNISEGEAGCEIAAASVSGARDWLNAVGNYRLSLENSRPSEISALYEDATRNLREQEQNRLIEADAGDFFSEPAAAQGLEEWFLLPTWTLDEAVSLSLGLNPKVVNRRTLGGPAGGSPFRKEFRRRINVVERAVAAGELVQPLRPARFAIWADRRSSLEQTSWLAGSQKNEALSEPEAKLHGNTETKLRTLILGMAVKHYGLSLIPDKNVGSTAWAEIARDLAKLDLKIDPDTVKTAFKDSLDHARSRLGDSQDGKTFKKIHKPS